MSDRRPVGVVLTGGASKRMGADKATLVVDGKPMVVSVADALWEAGCHPVECQGGDRAAIGEYGLDVHPDPVPGAGPVPAILAALERHRGLDVAVAACDLADLTCETVRMLLDAGRGRPCHVAVARSGRRRHLLAVWRASALDPLAELVAAGVDAYLGALDRLTVIDVDVPACALRNVNSPEDLTPR